jgi:hypothetical protein
MLVLEVCWVLTRHLFGGFKNRLFKKLRIVGLTAVAEILRKNFSSH